MKLKKAKPGECCICHGPIDAQGTWKLGHNAEPVVQDGRCCTRCNNGVVIPIRLARLVKRVAKENL